MPVADPLPEQLTNRIANRIARGVAERLPKQLPKRVTEPEPVRATKPFSVTISAGVPDATPEPITKPKADVDAETRV